MRRLHGLEEADGRHAFRGTRKTGSGPLGQRADELVLMPIAELARRFARPAIYHRAQRPGKNTLALGHVETPIIQAAPYAPVSRYITEVLAPQ